MADNPAQPILESPPVFIVGCPRSGTTLLRLIIDSHPNISCGPETQFLSEFYSVVGPRWERMKHFGFDKPYWHRKIAAFFGDFQRDYAVRRGKIRWADKSPSYTLCLDFLNELFPSCQVVHITRDPRAVALSYRERWGYWAALKAPGVWAEHLTKARVFGRKVGEKRYFELRYEDLVQQTEETLKPLFEFLKEPWDPVVLRFHEIKHDIVEWFEQKPVHTERVDAWKKTFDPLLKLCIRLKTGNISVQANP